MNDPAPVRAPGQTPFVGRIDDLDAVGRLLRKVSRLVTITGVPGIGKTRLAIRLGQELEHRFPGGVRHAEPAHVPDDMPDGRVLVIWDACDAAVDSCRSAAISLLRDHPDLHLLTTSRGALGVPGEKVWEVGPLTEADAIKLVCERAGLDRITDDVRRLVGETPRRPSDLEAAADRTLS